MNDLRLERMLYHVRQEIVLSTGNTAVPLSVNIVNCKYGCRYDLKFLPYLPTTGTNGLRLEQVVGNQGIYHLAILDILGQAIYVVTATYVFFCTCPWFFCFSCCCLSISVKCLCYFKINCIPFFKSFLLTAGPWHEIEISYS